MKTRQLQLCTKTDLKQARIIYSALKTECFFIHLSYETQDDSTHTHISLSIGNGASHLSDLDPAQQE